MAILIQQRGVVKRIVGGSASPEPGHIFGAGILPEEPSAVSLGKAVGRQPTADSEEGELGPDYDAWLAAHCAEDFDQRVELDADDDELLDFEREPSPEPSALEKPTAVSRQPSVKKREARPAPVRAVGSSKARPDPEASDPCSPEVWLLRRAGYYESLGGEGSLWLADRIRHLARLARITQASTFWQIDDREEVLERRCF